MNEIYEKSVIARREIEPLLARAGQLLSYYAEATDCPAAVVDRLGFTVRTPEIKKQMKYCEFCVQNSEKSSADGKRVGTEYPCAKNPKEAWYQDVWHLDALAESRRIEGSHIYSCPAGYVYWTSPLYRNGHYAGALIAGQVLPCERSPEEIEALAVLLGVCAEEISEKKEEAGDIIRRMIWREESAGESHSGRDRKKNPALDKWPADSEHLMEKERLLFAAFRRGDNDTGGKILEELMDMITASNSSDIELARFRAMELVILLSRSGIGEAGRGDPAADGSCTDVQEANNKYLKRILESKTMEELTGNLRLIAERMSGKIFSFKGVRHASVLRKAERYIWENYTRKISLEEIAGFSGLSAPYFSTVFKEEMGENLSSYLNRLRVEKAANLLTATGKPLDEIAKLCGFEDQSWFSKIFKSFTGVSPGKFRETGNGVPAFANIKKARESNQ